MNTIRAAKRKDEGGGGATYSRLAGKWDEWDA